MYTLAIDWGETVGFTLFFNEEIVLTGNDKNVFVPLTLLEQLPISFLVMEKNQFKDGYRFTEQIENIKRCSERLDVAIEYVYPSLWKHSFAKSYKIKLTKHAQDSARIGHYWITKRNRDENNI